MSLDITISETQLTIGSLCSGYGGLDMAVEAFFGARPVGMRGSLRKKGRLSPRFVEWMMGLPAGWVTDPALGLSRPEQLKALGNGVVPQQALYALELMEAA